MGVREMNGLPTLSNYCTAAADDGTHLNGSSKRVMRMPLSSFLALSPSALRVR